MHFLKNLFKSNTRYELPVHTDMHSHLLPGIDDGSPDIATTLQLAEGFVNLGIKKAVFTPHIIADYYPNTPEIITPLKDKVQEEIRLTGIELSINAAAEYYLDETFINKIDNKEPLLTFGDNYLLFETSFMNRPLILEQVIFSLKTNAYNPVFAHPERYVYLQEDFSAYEDLYNRGIKFQINLMSLAGHYSKQAQKVCEKLIDHKMVDFIGTDCHHPKHLPVLEKALRSKYIDKLAGLNLLNDTI